MSDALSFAEIADQRLELLPARTVLSTMPSGDGGGMPTFDDVKITGGEGTGGDDNDGTGGGHNIQTNYVWDKGTLAQENYLGNGFGGGNGYGGDNIEHTGDDVDHSANTDHTEKD